MSARMIAAVAIIASMGAIAAFAPAQALRPRQTSGPAMTSRPPSQPNTPAGVKAFRDVQYATVGNIKLRMDVLVPTAQSAASAGSPAGPLPLVVFIHGGGWRMGSKEANRARFLVPRGYVVASINYRLTPQASWPAQIEDCKAAIRYLRAHASDYSIDPERVGVFGTSAGGHLAALLGTSGEIKGLEGGVGECTDQSSRVQAVVDFFGPADFPNFQATPQVEAIITSPKDGLFRGTADEIHKMAVEASPVTHATKDDPPFLICHGDKDTTVPIRQSELLETALKKAGVDVTFHVVKGAGHGFNDPKIDLLVAGFFDKHLKKAATQPATAPATATAPAIPPSDVRR